MSCLLLYAGRLVYYSTLVGCRLSVLFSFFLSLIHVLLSYPLVLFLTLILLVMSCVFFHFASCMRGRQKKRRVYSFRADDDAKSEDNEEMTGGHYVVLS